MLPASNRLRRSDDFRRAVRAGRRAGRRTVVVHLLAADGLATGPGSDDRAAPRVGFVVSRAVGGAVRRNLVRRRLRAVMAAELRSLPAGSLTVVRALPASADAAYAELASDTRQALRRLTGAR